VVGIVVVVFVYSIASMAARASTTFVFLLVSLVLRTEERWWCAELHRLRGALLAAMDADETQIEASFREAIRIVKEQKSISL
jgi:hypothetical protein